ncbi:MAG: hypothetical protein GY796_31750 [Chloroflexi bacterium]|nr:hypothetical protein [Chloroflexota bacterium]
MMNRRIGLLIGLAVVFLAGVGMGVIAQDNVPQASVQTAATTNGVGTTFTYQGVLTDSGDPADGVYDLQFKLYDAANGGQQVGGAVTLDDATVTDGLFVAELDSIIYKWNGASFVEMQTILTNGALDWEFFTVGSEAYLAVANYYDGTTYNIDSTIYRWNGTSFVQFQTVPTNSAWDWKFFTIGSDHYLTMANHSDGTTWNIDSKISSSSGFCV